jgi:AraC family transcriptional regulator of adaptative response/methylated-DNA-[protein]-cysteine methyltransferase
LSQFHFHRPFSAWAALTPKDFLRCLTLAHAKEWLRKGDSAMDVAFMSGLSDPGRLHDLCINLGRLRPA